MIKVLLLEDDLDLSSAIQQELIRNGYSVDCLSDGETGMLYALNKDYGYDLAIVDRMLPVIDGLTIIKAMRRKDIQIPVIIITGMSALDDRIDGLDGGADDYLVKPFSFQELEARIKALLRRSGNESVHMALRCGDLVLDPPSHRAIRNGQVIDLTVKEYRLLEYFIQNQGTALSRMNLLKNVWDKDFDTNTNVVDVYVNYLRTKIDKDFEPKLIHTVVGVGYMMEA